MKKSLFIVMLLCLATTMMGAKKETRVKGAHPYKTSENKLVAPEFAHWSLIPQIGFNIFDGDFRSEMEYAIAIPNIGIGVEYAFTPVWLVGLDYMYDRYTVTGKKGGNNADTLLNGNMHKLGVHLGIDLTNLFFPRMERKYLTLVPQIGTGYAFYRNNIMYPDETRGKTKNATPNSMSDYNGTFFIRAGLDAEINLNRTLAAGLRASYCYFMNDYIDNRGYATDAALASKNNDGIFDVNLYLRIKFEAKYKNHIHNIHSYEVIDDHIKGKRQPVVAHDTVIIRHDSIIVREVEKVEYKRPEQVYYVYYENDKSNLNDQALSTVQQVADRLDEDPSLYAVVTGYADMTGNRAHNTQLGDRRAESVINELELEHSIPMDHVYYAGLGQIEGKNTKGSYAPNRRTAIRLVDKETFDQLKEKIELERIEKQLAEPVIIDEVKTLSLAETMRKEKKKNEYVGRQSEQVVVDKTTTLAKLARQYYDNTYCWVYIYLANKDRIANPNALVPGTILMIPELTEEEVKTNQEKCLQLYNEARSMKQ